MGIKITYDDHSFSKNGLDYVDLAVSYTAFNDSIGEISAILCIIGDSGI